MAKNKTHMSKEEVRKANKDLEKSNKKIADEHMEEVYKVVNKNLGVERQAQSAVQDIIDIFYDNMEQVFKNTSHKLYKIYPKAKDYKVEDIFSITYDKDGKTIEERIKVYWKDALDYLKTEDFDIVKNQLIDKYYRLMINETAIVERVIKQHKVKPIVEYLAIEGCGLCCKHCAGISGEYHADEIIDLPPYHPGCTCFHYYFDDENDEMENESIEITVEEEKEE